MDRIINYTISSADAGLSVERFLRQNNYTRQSITELKKYRDNTIIAGEWVHINHILKEGDVLTVLIHEDAASETIVPVKLPLSIVYEDEDILIIDKAAKMPIHPSLNNYENTLGNAVAYYYNERNENFVFRCINRLDRDTTGLTLIAKHFVAAGILYNQMVNRQIKRKYLAIVEGAGFDEEGTIDLPIGRVEGSSIERFVDLVNGERAITHYRVIKRFADRALVELKLDTGRTHQIRVHMKHIGHPLVGDFLYNPDNTLMDRQALHSHELSFYHPMSGEKMNFVAEIPDDMKQLLQ